MFKKAEPVSPYFKCAMYGKPGSGKTFTALLMAEGLAEHRGKRIAYVDTEHGTKYYTQRVKERAVHPDAFDFDILDSRSIAEIDRAVRSLDPAVYGIIVIDSISHLWDAAKEAYVERNGLKLDDDIPMRAWDKIKRPYKRLLKFVSIESPFDTFVLGREKTAFKSDGRGGFEAAGVAMRAEAETQFEPDVCLHMVQIGKGGEKGTISMFGEKDRSGILEGRTVTDPSFQHIKPFLAYLGDTAPPVDDEEKRTNDDAELMESMRAQEKRAKSKALLAEFSAKLVAADGIEALGKVGAEIKKKKRTMIQSDIDALVTLYEQRRADVAAQHAETI